MAYFLNEEIFTPRQYLPRALMSQEFSRGYFFVLVTFSNLPGKYFSDTCTYNEDFILHYHLID